MAVKPVSPKATFSSAAANHPSSFRNVSACNRCRLRKNRCDQRLPACAACEKANVKCVGFDPITKREIPRSYVFFLESRVSYLESFLADHGIPFAPPEDFALGYKTAGELEAASGDQRGNHGSGGHTRNVSIGASGTAHSEEYDREKLDKLVSNIGMVSVQGTSDPRYLGSTSGISFARVVFAAVKSSVSGASSERGSTRPSKPLPGAAAAGGTTMRDSFFGLHTKPTIKPAPFPDRELGLKLVGLYFEHANPQIPILHRGEFMSLFERTYASEERHRTPRELYMLNIVFAIGAGIIMGSSSDAEDSPTSDQLSASMKPPLSLPNQKRRMLVSHQHQPEEYHASAIVHLESFLSSSPAADRPDGFGGGLEELQAVLLLAGFALLRPVAPGLWYIIGVAVRLGVDLGLHYEDGIGIDGMGGNDILMDNGDDVMMGSEDDTVTERLTAKIDARERGRRQWIRDLRRRLWWCVYSFDRLVSTCVGRPFGIMDQVVTTEFPSLLDDKHIATAGFLTPPSGSEKPSYKFVSYHYFRLRLLQSEILQVLQHRQAQQAGASGASSANEYMHTNLPSPFLQNFKSFRAWRTDIDRRLWEWKESAPTQMETGVQFSPLFLELNYWQAIIMLYRQSLTAPPILAGELGPTNEDVQSPLIPNPEEREDEERVFMKVAEAGQQTLKIYRQLHRVHLVNYTFLATHHLFMAGTMITFLQMFLADLGIGISFLYAIWHSTVVRSHLSLDDVDFTVLAATSVLGDLIEKCPPAEACRDAFERMSKATIQMCLSTTGFRPQASGLNSRQDEQTLQSSFKDLTDLPHISSNQINARVQPVQQSSSTPHGPRRRYPQFDMNFRDLFSEDDTDVRSLGGTSNTLPGMRQPQRPQRMPNSKQESSSCTSNLNLSPQLHETQSFPLSTNGTTSARPTSSSVLRSPLHQPNASLYSPYHTPNQVPYSSFMQLTQTAYPDLGGFSDLDFLDSFSMQENGGVGGTAAENLDLGFGMGFDATNHDWADGNGFDLFDGFFFGGGLGGGCGGV